MDNFYDDYIDELINLEKQIAVELYAENFITNLGIEGVLQKYLAEEISKEIDNEILYQIRSNIVEKRNHYEINIKIPMVASSISVNLFTNT